jgi:GNAT superfamily N-acetyltransferase
MAEFVQVDPHRLYELAVKDYARNYFICHTLDKNQPYASAFGWFENQEPIIGIFLRQTGLIQIAIADYEKAYAHRADISRQIEAMSFDEISFFESYAAIFESSDAFDVISKGANIAYCTKDSYNDVLGDESLFFKWINKDELEPVVALYQKVFKSFASEDAMKVKLLKGRGRALGGYIGNKLISVAQTDYEDTNSALIVGVATDPKYQGKGYGEQTLRKLMQPLLQENKKLTLQYDSSIAGQLYKKLGFINYDRVIRLRRR